MDKYNKRDYKIILKDIFKDKIPTMEDLQELSKAYLFTQKLEDYKNTAYLMMYYTLYFKENK